MPLHATLPTPYPRIALGALVGWTAGQAISTAIAMFLGGMSPLTSALCLLILPLGILLGTLCAMGLPGNAIPLRELLALPHAPTPISKRLAHALAGAFLLLVALAGMGWLCRTLLLLLGCNAGGNPSSAMAGAYGVNWLALVVFCLNACLIVPIAEELLFRRLIPAALADRGLSERLAIGIAAVLFALVHMTLWAMPGYILFAVCQSITLKKRDLLQCMMVHALYNTITLALLAFFLSQGTYAD